MTNVWILRGTAVVLALSGLAFGAGMFGYLRLSHARKASLEDWNRGRCAVYRATSPRADDPCGAPSDARLFPAFEEARASVADARAALARGDEDVATRDLVRALGRANALEARSTLFATALAARATGEVLDVLDAHPRLARREDLRAAILDTKLATARRPLDAHRLRVGTAALRNTPRTAVLTWGATHMRVADAIEREDAALVAMQHAARTGDVAACERAAAGTSTGPYVCKNLVETARVGRRLGRARLAATIIPK